MITAVIILSPQRKDFHKFLVRSIGWQYPIIRELILVVLDTRDISYLEDVFSTLKNKAIRIRIIYESKEKTLAYCRNIGAKNALEKYIAFLDDDVILDKEWGRNLASILKNGFKIVFGALELPQLYKKFINERRKLIYTFASLFNKKIICKRSKKISKIVIFKPLTDIDYLLCTRGLWGANLIIEKETLKKLGYFDEQLGYRKRALIGGEDSDIIIKAYKKGINVCFAENVIAYHFVDTSKLTLKYAIKKYSTIPYISSYYNIRHRISIFNYLFLIFMIIKDDRLSLIEKIDFIAIVGGSILYFIARGLKI